jgi:NlpC/P60 family
MRFFLVLPFLLGCALAHAAPGDGSDDEMNLLLEERGVISRLGSQIKLARDEVGGKASDLVVGAMGFLGVPYRYGGNSAETGFDCSGLVRKVFEQSVGKILPRRADEQASATVVIDRSDLKPGDLVFFNTMKRAFSHVGIYVGEGKFIHAPRAGGAVRVEDMRVAYWQARFNGARRVPLVTSDNGGAPR